MSLRAADVYECTAVDLFWGANQDRTPYTLMTAPEEIPELEDILEDADEEERAITADSVLSLDCLVQSTDPVVDVKNFLTVADLKALDASFNEEDRPSVRMMRDLAFLILQLGQSEKLDAHRTTAGLRAQAKRTTSNEEAKKLELEDEIVLVDGLRYGASSTTQFILY